MKLTFSIFLSCFVTTLALAQEDSIVNRFVMIGDAGNLINGTAPVINAVRKFVPLDKKTTVIFVGDNLYRTGLPDDQYTWYKDARKVLDSQVALVTNTQASAFFIPGNHDWKNGGADGWASIVREQKYIDGLRLPNVSFYPKGGCPGPVEIDVSKDIVLIIMDSQWWLHKSEKPGIESDCAQKTEDEILAELEEIAANNPKKLILFAFHHTFRSNGIHGGYFGIKQHIFPLTDIKKNLYVPLPVIGSLYPISRSVFGSPQDLKFPTYQNMKSQVEGVLKEYPHVIFLHGHEHSLQYFSDSNYNYVVTGSGCKETRVEKSKTAEFVSPHLGFATLEVSKNKNVRLTFYDNSKGDFEEAFTKNILNFSSVPQREDTIPKTEPVYIYKETALVPASTQYDSPNRVRQLMIGENYRAEWNTPVKLKVFNINKEHGGLRITEMGGGNQTKSLTLADKTGREWKLRTIDKDPSKVLPPNLRITIAKDILQDMISAAHPYAPAAIPKLSEAVNVPHTNPQFFFVPDDPSLGIYKPFFADKVCILEEKAPVPKNVNTKSTTKILNDMIEDNDHVTDQQPVLRARLLDILIGDWDRHFDQWRWETRDTGRGKIYYPIPKDRDQAFFYSDGLMLRYAARRRLPFLKGFRYNIPRVNWLSYTARDFDRLFLNRLDEADWERTIDTFQHNITDSVISAAVHDLPPEVYPLHGPEIEKKLSSRRDLLKREGMRYYRFLSRYVNVLGSNKQEYFKVKGDDTSITVNVYVKEKDGDTNFQMYSRKFDPKITKEVRLYGFNGNDMFSVDSNVASPIKLRIIGGRGNDTFDLKGKIHKYLYDLRGDANPIIARSRTRNLMSNDPMVNEYNYKEFRYQEVQRFPWINVGYNTEDGLLAGVGFWRRTYNFRKEPYGTDNRLTTLYSFLGDAYQVKYSGTFVDVYRKIDVVGNAEFQNPSLSNFFGLGNETVKAPGTKMYYYRSRYKFVQSSALLRVSPVSKVYISAGPSFYYYWNKYSDNADRILGKPEAIGLDSFSIYNPKMYLGGKFSINVNNINNEIFPTRGVDWTNEVTYMDGMNSNSKPFGKFTSDMVVYASLSDPARVVAVIRLGGGHIFSKDFEYFQALTLGSNNFLRGFRKNRFSGVSLAYNSVELRIKLADIRSYVFPGTLGLITYNDIGRVWLQDESSKKWHDTYGAGVYYMPFNLFILSAAVGFSPEETLFNVSVGTKLNLTF